MGKFIPGVPPKPWKEGEASPNPGGVPKVLREIHGTIRAIYCEPEKDGTSRVEKVLARLYQFATEDEPKVAVPASQLLLERVLGRPRQAPNLDKRPEQMSDAELRAKLSEAASSLGCTLVDN